MPSLVAVPTAATAEPRGDLLPAVPVEAAATVPPARQRHRAVTVPSGLVLFACLFLPMVRGCDESIYPTQAAAIAWPLAPLILLPYGLGLMAVIAALGRSPRTGDELGRARRRATVIGGLAVVSVAWFALLVGQGALVGVQLALAASLWLGAGTIVWRVELHAPAANLPRAEIRRPWPRPRPLWLVAIAMLGTFWLAARAPRTPPASKPLDQVDLSGLFGC